MDLPSTPRAKFSRRKFVSPAASTPYRSPLIHNVPEKKVRPSVENIPLDELKACTKELWKESKDQEEKIQDLQQKLIKEGFKEEEDKERESKYIDEVHRYNEIKDVAQTVMGKLAILDQVTIKAMYEEFGLTEND